MVPRESIILSIIYGGRLETSIWVKRCCQQCRTSCKLQPITDHLEMKLILLFSLIKDEKNRDKYKMLLDNFSRETRRDKEANPYMSCRGTRMKGVPAMTVRWSSRHRKHHSTNDCNFRREIKKETNSSMIFAHDRRLCWFPTYSARENITWSHTSYDTMLPYLKIRISKFQKNSKLIMWAHIICVCDLYNFQNQFRNIHRGTKKTNPHVNSDIGAFVFLWQCLC
jgi:hypothetical protein